MSVSTSNMHVGKRPDLNAAVRRRFIQLGIGILIQAIALFGAAGHLDWRAAWVYLITYIIFIGLNAILMLPHRKDLIAERAGMNADVRSWDKTIMVLVTILTPTMLLVAGFDDRFGWSPFNNVMGRAIAFGLMIAADLLITWAMMSNAYFSSLVRIQTDRGQTVISDGPYRFVRHPGYVSMILTTLTTPFVLGSLVALIPALLLTIVIIVRTGLEDRTLQNELGGYSAYTQHVRYRLLPGLW